MATRISVNVIDADAHVIETERTWEFLEKSEEQYRPKLYSNPADPSRQYWVIDDKIRGFRFPTLSEKQLDALSSASGRSVNAPLAAREMDDLELRLHHMSELGIDLQILHNTLWIEQVTDNEKTEAALCGSWNRWMADIWKRSDDRLRWSAVLPYLTPSEAINQMRFAKENGAVAICVRPFEGTRIVTDPFYYPIYEEAERLGLAVAIHISNGNPSNCDLLRSRWDGGSSFAMFRAPTVVTAHTLLMSNLHELFPNLNWGLIEASAQWVPWVLREAKSRRDAGRMFTDSSSVAGIRNWLSDWNIFVTCQTDDDVPYLIRDAGEDWMVIGTDYGHFDPSSEIDAISVFKEKFGNSLSPDVMKKVLLGNAQRLYNLS